jgi:hypothetical protein
MSMLLVHVNAGVSMSPCCKSLFHGHQETGHTGTDIDTGMDTDTDMDIGRETATDMETDMETWRHGDMETWRHGDMETWRHGDMEAYGTDGKRQLLFFFCKRKTETANFSLFAANGNGKQTFVFLGWKTINGNRRLLFQQSAHLCSYAPSFLFLEISL